MITSEREINPVTMTNKIILARDQTSDLLSSAHHPLNLPGDVVRGGWHGGVALDTQPDLISVFNLLFQFLTLSQMTKFRLFQIERVCRQQFHI